MKNDFDTAVVKVNKRGFTSRRTKDLIFYSLLFALPVLQFFVFYICVNANSVLQAFTRYEISDEGRYVSFFSGFENFKSAFQLLKDNSYTFKYSFIAYGVGLFIGFPLGLIFSFYIYKKLPLSGAFKIFLFMPQLISALIFSLLFNYITSDVYIELVRRFTGNTQAIGLLYNEKTALGTILFFNVWCSFGVNVLLYSGSMSGIDNSIVESAKLDGANYFKEFIHITLPLIYPTIMQMLIVGVSYIFINQMQLMSLYGLMAKETGQYATFGIFLYLQTQGAKLTVNNGVSIGILSATGLILTAFVLPATLLVRKLLVKFGPKTV